MFTNELQPDYNQRLVSCTKKVFSKTTGGMECSIASNYTNGASPGAPNERTAGGPKAGLHVNFIEKGEVKEKREKFLTAKYGSHQMSLIRKRLAVEMWLYDELQKLYEIPEVSSGTSEVEVDIDELLDMDSDSIRTQHLKKLLSDAKKSQLDVNKFIEDLLGRIKTL
ncbi:hypothetical protein M8J75_005557 [Diaphorina citri]|nr:hypothetical protein M8J75_005557 [Diaphorina citri]